MIPIAEPFTGLLQAAARAMDEALWAAPCQEPRPGSRAAMCLATEAPPAYPGADLGPVGYGLGMVDFAFTSALDHTYALGKALEQEQRIGTPLAAVARGALEAFGRAYYLFKSENPDGIIRSNTISMLSDALGRRPAFKESPEYAKENDAYILEMRSKANALGIPKDEQRKGYSSYVYELLQDTTKLNRGPVTYSNLSAVAHCERAGFLQLSIAGPYGEVMWVITPNYLRTLVAPIIYCMPFTVNKWLDFYGVPKTEGRRVIFNDLCEELRHRLGVLEEAME
jgi:hypothetical protein